MNSQYDSTHRWDLIWQFNILRNDRLALLNRALHIHIRDLLAEICFRANKSNQAILDLQKHIRASLNLFLYCSNSLDRERVSSVSCVS